MQSPVIARHTAPGTLYRRALNRVDRRRDALIAIGQAEALDHGHPSWSHVIAGGPCIRWSLRREVAKGLLAQAVGTANRLAHLAGYGGDYARLIGSGTARARGAQPR